VVFLEVEFEDMMATGSGPSVWLPGALRAREAIVLGPSAARRAARVRRQRACEAVLRDLLGDGAADPGGWRDREQAARPALQLRAAGLRVPGRARRRRNAAWHAAAAPSCGFVRASDDAIAQAAAGPRLEEVVGRAAAAMGVPPAQDRLSDGGAEGEQAQGGAGAVAARLSADAAVFVPRVGRGDGDGDPELKDDGGFAPSTLFPGLWEVCHSSPLLHDVSSDLAHAPAMLAVSGLGGSASTGEYAPGAWAGCPQESDDESHNEFDVVDEVAQLVGAELPVQTRSSTSAASSCWATEGLGHLISSGSAKKRVLRGAVQRTPSPLPCAPFRFSQEQLVGSSIRPPDPDAQCKQQ